jgi:hypothetical protein
MAAAGEEMVNQEVHNPLKSTCMRVHIHLIKSIESSPWHML